MIFPFIIFFLILSALVIIHELGHFIAAKKNGIMVHEFGFGLPTEIFGKKKGETEYTLNALPISGFVRSEGEEAFEKSADLKRSFLNKPPKVKLLVLMAGVLMNILLAVVLYYFFFIFNNFISNPLIKFSDYSFLGAKQLSVDTAISGITNDKLKNKLREGDLVYNASNPSCIDPSVVQDVVDKDCSLNSLNSTTLKGKNKRDIINTISTNIKVKEFQKFINGSGTNPVKLYIYNVSERTFREVEVTPYFDSKLNRNVMGVYLGSVFYLDYGYSIWSKIFSSPLHSINVLGYSTVSFANLIGISLQKQDIQTLSSGVSGPIGIFTIVKSVLESKSPDIFWLIIDLSALISLSLAFMNALPIPALDGGRAVFVLIEMLFKKRVSPMREALIHKIGMICLLVLIALVTLKDFINLF